MFRSSPTLWRRVNVTQSVTDHDRFVRAAPNYDPHEVSVYCHSVKHCPSTLNHREEAAGHHMQRVTIQSRILWDNIVTIIVMSGLSPVLPVTRHELLSQNTNIFSLQTKLQRKGGLFWHQLSALCLFTRCVPCLTWLSWTTSKSCHVFIKMKSHCGT